VAMTDTFNLFTRPYTPKKLVDQIFTGTPTLKLIRQKMRAVEGASYKPLLQNASLTPGAGYTRTTQFTGLFTPEGDIATSAEVFNKQWAQHLYIPSQDIKLNTGDKLVDYFTSYVKNAEETARMSLSTSFFAQGSELWDPLGEIINDAAWAGITPASSGFHFWKAHVMAGTSTYSVAVSATRTNFAKMIRTIVGTTGKKPGMILTDESTWDYLWAQFTTNDFAMAQANLATKQMMDWGFDAFSILGVPVVSDRGFPSQAGVAGGEDWVSGQSTRATANGHDAYFINWDDLFFGYTKGRALQWGDTGWESGELAGYDGILNYLYLWGLLACDERRLHGRIFNMDLDQTENDWTGGTVTIPKEG